MPKVKISEYSATANSNTDVASINIDEGCAPSGINNAIRAVMGHLKDFQSGTYGDPFNGPVNGTLGATTASTANVTTLTTSSTVTHNGGTANGVAYLNGSKVLTTGSALTYASGTLSSLATTSSAFNGAADAGYSLFRGTTNSSGGVLSVSGNSTGNGINYTVFNSTLTGYEPANYGASQHIWKLGATEALRLNSSANLVLQGGTTTANGIGITFPATQSASSDANTLDDYEEGTFTPSLSFGDGAVGLTYNYRVGIYVKVGNVVSVFIRIALNNKGSSTGHAGVSGLPFAANGTTDAYQVAYVGLIADMSGLTSKPFGQKSPNASSFYFYQITSSNYATLTQTNFSSSSTLNIQFTYLV